MQLDFELAGQKNSMPVRFYGVVPKNFIAGKEVVVEGKLNDYGVFEASKILTRCKSKYKVKLKTNDYEKPDKRNERKTIKNPGPDTCSQPRWCL